LGQKSVREREGMEMAKETESLAYTKACIACTRIRIGERRQLWA